VLAGCTGIPRAGPLEKSITEKSADLAGFTLIEMSADTVSNYRVESSSDAAGTAGVPGVPEISLSSGDVLRLKISETRDGGIFLPLASGGTTFDNVRVDHKGDITIPYVGRVKVAGLNLQQVEERLRSRLAGVTFEPQVYVELVSDRGSSILVSGEVKAPGRFSLLEGPLTLIDAIAKAGGPTKPAHQMDVIIRRGKTVSRTPLAIVQGGNNQQLRTGDELTLEINAKVFNALGAVKQTGQLEFSKLYPTLLDALAQLGGLDNTNSSSTGVFVFRLREPKAWLDADNKWQEGPVIFKFDMTKPEMMFIAQAFGVRPNDTIYVTNAPSVEWTRSLSPIAQTMSTIQGGISLGKSVSGIVAP
jgi:polysaccharide export outer membrane protein